jgi:photosystem II stability/assembly factor-like uncharacterized protein
MICRCGIALIAVVVSGVEADVGQPAWRAAGPSGAHVSRVEISAADPSRAYALTWDGLFFRSENGGVTWQRSSSPDPSQLAFTRSPVVTSDPSDPNVVYLGHTTGVLRSGDGGLTFSDCSAGLVRHGEWSLEHPYVVDIAVDPVNPRVLYAATRWGVMKSIDSSHSWQATALSEPASAVSVDPRTRHLLAVAGDKVWHSRSGGMRWAAVAEGCKGGRVAADPLASIAYVSSLRDLHLSVDGGKRWFKHRMTDYVASLVIDPHQAGGLYALTTNGNQGAHSVARSDDLGEHWSRLPLPDCQITWIAAARGLLLLGTPAGILRSTDRGASWSDANTGIEALSVADVAVASDPAVAFAASAGGGVLCTEDGGRTWRSLDLGGCIQWGRSVAISPHDVRSVVAVVGGSVFRSDDAGRSWARVPEPPGSPGALSVAFAPSDRNVQYMGTADGVWRSEDGGYTFRPVKGYPWQVYHHSGSRIELLAVDPRDSRVVYAGADLAGLFRSTDAGGSWELVYPRIGIELAVPRASPAPVFYLADGRLSRSLDKGETWEDITPTPLGVESAVTAFSVAAERSSVIFALTRTRRSHQPWDASAMMSRDGGTSWDKLPSLPRHSEGLAAGNLGTFPYLYGIGMWTLAH